MDQLNLAAPCTLNLVWRSYGGQTLVVWHTTLREAIERFMAIDEDTRAEAWICVKGAEGSLRDRLTPHDIAAYAGTPRRSTVNALQAS